MSDNIDVSPTRHPRQVRAVDGRTLTVPDGWALLAPGDPALSRRIKQVGPTWTVIEVKGRKRFSHGIWAPAAHIETLRAERRAELEDPAYQKKLDAGRRRRDAAQTDYVEDFRGAIVAYLAFHPRYATEAGQLAELITTHATPVGSGTVARTTRIPIEQRAQAATIAWLRHQTTTYDTMTIARVKGLRREVRRELAQKSVRLLDRYRRGESIAPASCPLLDALRGTDKGLPASEPFF